MHSQKQVKVPVWFNFLGQSLDIKLYIIYYILKINIITYFENLTVKLHVPYTFNTCKDQI